MLQASFIIIVVNHV